MPNERPSPFTIPEPIVKFAEGPPSEPPPPRSMTVEGLIHNLTSFADFYERATSEIERAAPLMQLHATGARDANAEHLQRCFRATPGIERVRGYVLAQYGEDLTVGTARRVLGDLIRVHKLSVVGAGALSLDAAMDQLDMIDGKRRSEAVKTEAGSSFARSPSSDLETKGEIMGDSSEKLRTPDQLLDAFGKAAARFSTTRLKIAAFQNAARGDGLTTIPASFIPKNEHGQPAIGQINIGGISKTYFPGVMTYYGIGGARFTSAGTKVNVGFVIYGRSPEDDAVATFRELGSEAGVISHLRGFGPEIQSYDNPFVLWASIVYSTLQGSGWLSQLDVVSETLAHHFHPFTASVEVLKRLTGQTGPGSLPSGNPPGPANVPTATPDSTPAHQAVPVWEGTSRRLMFRGQECKRFRRPAPDQEKILAAFQEEGWPEAIDDPLTSGKLSRTVESLNDRLQHIKFSLNGANTGVCWRAV
jgi:hypothetical protein